MTPENLFNVEIPETLHTGADEAEELTECILDMGELLLVGGAEIMRVEDTINRLCAAYQFKRSDVFTIPSGITLTVRTADNRTLSKMRRVRNRGTNLGLVERLNELSRRLTADPLPAAEFRRALNDASSVKQLTSRHEWLLYMVISAAFAIFYGGTAHDAVAAALSGLVLFAGMRLTGRLRLNNLLQVMVASALTGLAIIVLTRIGLAENPDMVISGNNMPIIPGVALVTALRDLINGDTVSGLFGVTEATLKALGIALGFAVVTTLGGCDMQAYLTQIVTAGIGAFGFGALFKLPPRRLPVVAAGGMAGWFVYILATAIGGLSYFNALFLGALFVAILSEILARVLRTPTIVLIVPMLIPLVPGGDLFHMMTNLVTEQEEAFTESLHQVFAAAGAIALAIIVVSAVVTIITAVGRRQ